jgi:ABC-type branched-subunit amino acid transport system permease subunit
VEWYSIVVGLVLVFIVLFIPKGLLGFRRAFRWRLRRAPA